MEAINYDRFSSSESQSCERHYGEAPTHTPTQQNRRFYIMFGVLSVFLLLLTLSVGIKITQVNQRVSDLVSSLQSYRTSMKAAQTDPVSHHTVPLPVRGSCENDWVFYNNKCYYTSTQRLNWNDAEQNCVLRRAHLLVVNDREEMLYISQVTEEYLSYWIGLVEREGDGNWSWVDGTDFNSTKPFWAEGQPDDWNHHINGEDCGQIHSKSSSSISTHRLWNDADCTLLFKYICERPA